MPLIQRVWQANMQVYGADKVWRQLTREGLSLARCTVERLMRRMGLRGVMRGKVVRTTTSDSKAPCPLDRVNCQLKADRPNQLWVSDFTYWVLIGSMVLRFVRVHVVNQLPLVHARKVFLFVGKHNTAALRCHVGRQVHHPLADIFADEARHA